MINEILKTMSEEQKKKYGKLVVDSFKVGYKNALSDLLSQIRLLKADGFVVSEEMVFENAEMLLEKINNKKQENNENKNDNV
jgi:hypothetical protein